MADIILILVGLLVSLIGAKKGFISVIMKLVGLILATILAIYLHKGLAVYLYENFSFGKNIENTIITTIKDKVVENVVGENITKNPESEGKDTSELEDKKINMNFTEVIETIKGWGLYNKIENDENVVVQNEQEGKNILENTAHKITMYIMRVVAFAAIFVCVIIITAIVSLILNLLFMLPGLKTINKTGGFIAEMLLFLIKILVILAIISFLQPIEFVSTVINYINTKTIIIKWLYNNNLIFTLLNRYL